MKNNQIPPAGDVGTGDLPAENMGAEVSPGKDTSGANAPAADPPADSPTDLPGQILAQVRQVAIQKKHFPVPLRALLASNGPKKKRYVDKSDWVRLGPGLPATPTGPGESRRDPKMATVLLSEVLGSSIDELAAATVRTKWAEIVGPDIAQHCVVEKIEDKTITIRAKSTAWATQLRRLSYMIMEKVCEATDRRFVEKIVVLGPAGPTWKMGALSVPGRGPRDTYG